MSGEESEAVCGAHGVEGGGSCGPAPVSLERADPFKIGELCAHF